ncbi:MAG: glycosyltransferase [Bacteroidetes bacterium]|nr:glycosyltransferase [Bacteroidota bacterium]
MPTVVHMIRNFLPPMTSFVRNQVMHHLRYDQEVIFTEKNESPLYHEISSKYPAWSPIGSKLGQWLCDHLLLFTADDRKRLIAKLRETKPGLAHIHYGVEAVLFAPVLKAPGIPALVSFYGHDCTAFPSRAFGLGQYLLRKNVFNNPAVRVITAMSPDMEKDLLALGCPPGKIRVHYHGIDTNRFSRPREYREQGEITFLIISMLDPKKGHDVLIRAFARAVTETQVPIKLLIYGKGELESEIRHQVSDTGLDQIRFMGPLQFGSEEHISSLYTADVFVHPSRRSASGEKEGIPGAIVEAMASGLPVLSTFHAGIPYIIKDKVTGLLVRENDTDELSNAIVLLAQDASLRKSLGRAAREYSVDVLDIRKKELELEKLYDEVAVQTSLF